MLVNQLISLKTSKSKNQVFVLIYELHHHIIKSQMRSISLALIPSLIFSLVMSIKTFPKLPSNLKDLYSTNLCIYEVLGE